MFKSKGILSLLSLLSLLTLFVITTAVYSAIELNYFTAQWDGDQVTLRWETGTELNHSAFHVWRSSQNLEIDQNFQIDKDQAQRVTDQFILNPDQNPCTQQGYEYNFMDDTIEGGENGQKAYYYYLETFNCADADSRFQGDLKRIGGLEVLNPALATPTTTLFLPIVIGGD